MTEKQWKHRKSILKFNSKIDIVILSISNRAELEAKITAQKDEHIKSVEAEILQLKADIYNLKVCEKSDQ